MYGFFKSIFKLDFSCETSITKKLFLINFEIQGELIKCINFKIE